MIEFEWQYQWRGGYLIHPCTLHPLGQDAVFISQSSQRSQCNGDFSFEPLQLKLQFACINQLCLQMLPCICGVSLSVQTVGGNGERGISSSSISSSTSTPFRQHVRIYFFHLQAMNTRLIRLLCAPLSFPFSAMIERELSFTI